jgi:hypothetical protein
MTINAIWLCALLSVAEATTTRRTNGITGNVAPSSPVGKVVKLLEDMKKDLEAEEKADEENYDKLMCWCETNTKEKTQSIDDAEVAINSLESEVESRTSRAERLKKDIADHEAEAEKLLQSIESSEAQRDKEGKANQAAIVDLTKNIQMLKGAVIVLKKHQATEFPQIKVSLLETMDARPSAMDKLDSFMQSHDYGHLTAKDEARVDAYEHKQHRKLMKEYGGYTLAELQTLNGAKKLVKSFMQEKGNTGEIYGVLTTMYEQMQEDLKETEAKEAQAVTDFEAMMADLKESLKTEEDNAKRKTAEAGENKKALAAAKTSLEDNENTLASDTDFLANVKKTCKEMDEQWSVARKTRKEEILAVAEAIQILTEEEANDEAAEANAPAFLQLKSVRSRSTVRILAAKTLQKAAQKSGPSSSALLALSASVQLDGFVKVKKAINDMIADLKQQQKDEVKHKDFCNGEMHKNEMETIENTNSQKDLNAAISLLDEQIATLKKDKETTKAEIAQGKVDLQQANMDRVEENQQFIATVQEQRAAKVVLNKALKRLEDFYGRKDDFLQKTALLHKHRAKQTPPAGPGEYKSSSGAGPVVTMLKNVIGDCTTIEKEATVAEQEAQTAYEQFVTESNASQKAKEEAVVNMSEQLASKEEEQIGKKEDLAGAKEDAEELAAYLADLHKSCDFVLKNFDLRQEARGAEIEALGQALAILSGA